MIRSELIQKLADSNPGLRLADVEAVVDAALGAIVDRLVDGGRVELRGFGAFSVRSRATREARNPRTGDSVTVPAKGIVHFKAGKELRDRLNVA
jgi:integration host factor subunit beta